MFSKFSPSGLAEINKNYFSKKTWNEKESQSLSEFWLSKGSCLTLLLPQGLPRETDLLQRNLLSSKEEEQGPKLSWDIAVKSSMP